MRLINISGQPASGKTSVIMKAIPLLRERGMSVGVAKFDCLTSFDAAFYREHGIPVAKATAGNMCPDHYFLSHVEECIEWGRNAGLDVLITESAGLCNRCSPFIEGITGICVLDNIGGINAPAKMGVMLSRADCIVITKSDVVSPMEREIFLEQVRAINPRARVLHVNGNTGQGIRTLVEVIARVPELVPEDNRSLRAAPPRMVCSFCLGQTSLDEELMLGTNRSLAAAVR